jgi:malate dehydrogenase (oxaloacetate-decarboxylating)
VDLRLDQSVVGQLGLGAAGFGIAALIKDGGAQRVLAFDPDESSHTRARDHGIEVLSMEEVLAQSDVVVATTGRPGLITPDMVRPGQVILALTNPVPEIYPDDALAAGAAYAADGSAVNNVLGYPGIFRGALMAGADRITTAMKLAAAWALAGLTLESELVPDPLDRSVHDAVAEAVRVTAVQAGLGDPERVPPALRPPPS